MRLNINKQEDNNLLNNEISIILKYNKNNTDVQDFIQYLNKYNKNRILVHKGYESFIIDYKEIMLFYSENKSNYCKTQNGIYRIKKKLYELEDVNNDFIRISKKFIININYVKSFNTSQTGKIVVALIDGTEENVSRRRIRDLLDFLENRSL